MQNNVFPNLYEFSVPFTELNISFERIEISSGYPEGKAPPHFLELFEEVKSESKKYCHAKGGYRIIDKVWAEPKSSQLVFDNKSFQTGKIIKVQMKQAESLVVFVCTIGSGMENWANRLLNAGDFFKGYLVDSLASELEQLRNPPKTDLKKIENLVNKGGYEEAHKQAGRLLLSQPENEEVLNIYRRLSKVLAVADSE